MFYSKILTFCHPSRTRSKKDSPFLFCAGMQAPLQPSIDHYSVLETSKHSSKIWVTGTNFALDNIVTVIVQFTEFRAKNLQVIASDTAMLISIPGEIRTGDSVLFIIANKETPSMQTAANLSATIVLSHRGKDGWGLYWQSWYEWFSLWTGK